MPLDVPLGDLVALALALLAAGVISGMLAGLFGVGGGAVIVPVLYQIFGIIGVPEEVRMHLSVGTSLAIIIPTSVQSFRAHLKRDKVLKDVLRIWAVPIVLGVAVGGVLAAYVSGLVLKLVFVVVAGLNAVKLIAGRDDWRIADELPGRATLRGTGFGIGVASTLMGIGGGILGTSILTLYGRSIHNAVATSSGLGVLISIPAALAYVWAGWGVGGLPPLSLGFVSPIGFLLVAPLAAWVSPYGARLAHRLPKRQLEIGFGIFLVVVSGRFVLSLVA